MAPVNGSLHPRRTAVSTGSSKLATKPVVPVLPLRFVKRQAAQPGGAVTTAVPPYPTAAAEPKGHDEGSMETERTLHDTPAVATPHVTPRAFTHHGHGSGHAATSAAVAGCSSESVDAPPALVTSSTPAANGFATPGDRVSNQAGAAPGRLDADPMAPGPSTDVLVRSRGAPNTDMTDTATIVANPDSETKPPPVQGYPAKFALHRPPPSLSPTRYQMAPPFQPVSRSMGPMANGDLARAHRPPLPSGPPHMHQANASNGSVHFGAFHDSQSSSPAPLHSGCIAPPPGMPVPDGRAPHMMHPNGNGYPPVMPYGAEMIPATNFDTFGRPAAMAYGPMDYAPYANALGPSTPHSFHGSQSSAHPEEAGVFNQYPHGLRSGAGGPGGGDDQLGTMGRLYRPYDYSRMMPAPGLVIPPHPLSPGDNTDKLLGHLQRHFASPELADCALELRYTDDRAPPLRIPGHCLIFARSNQLFDLLRQQSLQGAPADGSPQTLLLQTESKWIRSDSFYMAVQRLYGLPLLRGPLQRTNVDGSDVTEAGSASDQLEFALSYAAAGQALEWGSVVRRGCEVATHLLSWQTVERILEFALERYADKGLHESFKYGEGSRILLNAAVTFIVHNFPSHLHLDVESTEVVPYARLPLHPPPPPSTVVPVDGVFSSASPEVSVQLGQGRRSQRLSGIQFGDLSFADNRNGATTETPKATQQAQPASNAILSRILLEVPYTQLKLILESSGSGNVNGWANAEARYRIIKTVVDERESRRRRVVEVILSGRVPDADMIRAGLCSPEPRDLGPWTALGWQEEILPLGNPDGPSLARKWVPLMELQGDSIADYP